MQVTLGWIFVGAILGRSWFGFGLKIKKLSKHEQLLYIYVKYYNFKILIKSLKYIYSEYLKNPNTH